jgi:protein arginine kinase activator
MEKCPITGKNCLKYKSFHVTDVSNNQTNSLNICEDCLSQLDQKNLKFDEKKEKDKKNEDCCGFCGMTIEEFVKSARLGCSKCYDKFEKHLYLIIEKIHRIGDKPKELIHTGSVPECWKQQRADDFDPYQFLLNLKQKLAIAIKNEKYKEANFLKNNIKDFDLLTGKLSTSQNLDEIKKEISKFIYNYFELEKEFKKETP